MGDSSASEGTDPRDILKYTFLRLQPAWRSLPATARAEGIRAAIALLEQPPSGAKVRTYSTVGLKAEVDGLLWTIAPTLEAVQELHARLSGTAVGPYLETRFSYLGMGRRSEYVGTHQHGGSEGGSSARSFGEKRYLFVYPFAKKREWYGLPLEERRRIMAEHIRAGHRFPGVEIHTGYSFGLDDMEFILSFGADSPAEFLDLVSELRGTEASRFTILETPIFSCVRVSPGRWFELAEGLP